MPDGLIVVLLLVVLAVGFIASKVHDHRTWKEFYAAPGYRPDAATRLHAALRFRGVRCKYETVGLGNNFAGMGNATNQTLKVLVHRDDLSAARQVKAEMPDV
ncbi:MAG: hypothetical protein WD645_01330 [Dehalococcoidia bacterium]